MAIGDALAAVCMERSGISPEQFAINHPAGALGRQLTLTVADLMVPAIDLRPLDQESSLMDVIEFLTNGSSTRGAVGGAWVRKSSGELFGLITDGDLRRTLKRVKPTHWPSVSAAAMATVDPIAVTLNTPAIKALEIIEHINRMAITVLLVTSQCNERIVGGFCVSMT